MLHAAARPPRQSLAEGPSTVFCVAVYEWMVVINPFSMPMPDLRMTCTSGDVSFCLLSINKKPGGLNDVIHTHCSPRQLLQSLTAGGDALDLVAINSQGVTICCNLVLELAMCRIIFHLVLEVFCICGHVNYTNDIDLGTEQPLVTNGLEHHATNSSKAVDTDIDRHVWLSTDTNKATKWIFKRNSR